MGKIALPFMATALLLVSSRLYCEAKTSRREKSSCGPRADVELELAFDKLDEDLFDGTDSENVEPNLNFVRKLLAEESSKAEEEQDKKFLEATNKFLRLDELSSQGEAFCNHEGYTILRQLYVATRSNPGKAKRRGSPTRRVDHILHQVAEKHAKLCPEIYLRTCREKLANFDSIKLRQIDVFMKTFITRRYSQLSQDWKKSEERRNATQGEKPLRGSDKRRRQLAPSKRRLQLKIINGGESVTGKKNGEIGYSVLRFLTKDDKSSNFIRSRTASPRADSKTKSELRRLIGEYLVNPCKEYVALLESDVFLPAQQDSKILGKISRVTAPTDNTFEFFNHWVRFGFCSIVVRDELSLTNFVTARAISKQH